MDETALQNLERLHSLLEGGAITSEEFAKAKADLMGKTEPVTVGNPVPPAEGSTRDAWSAESPKARGPWHWLRVSAMWTLAAFAAIGFIVLVVSVLTLSEDWASGLGVAALFGGPAVILFGLGKPRHRAAWIVPAAVGSFALFVVGIAFVPATEADKKVAASSTTVETTPQASASVSGAIPTLAAATETPTPIPASSTPGPGLVARIEKSIRDNGNASSEWVNLDNLEVSYEDDGGHLHVTIRPNKPRKDTELLSNASALSVVTGKAVWSTYAEVAVVTIAVKKSPAETAFEPIVSAIFTRQTAANWDYPGLRKTTSGNNKTVLCMADFYRIDLALWKSLGGKGCMSASDGGTNLAVAPADFRAAASLVESATPTAAPTATPSRTPTPTRIPDVVTSSLGRLTFTPFDSSLFGIRVHFVTSVTNTGNVPIEIFDLTYEMTSPSGAVVEVGDIPQSHPRKIGPGQTAVIGRTITADTATRVSDVANVKVTYKQKKASTADNLLQVLSAEYRGADQFGNLLVVGDVQNPSSVTYDDINIAVVLVDSSGRWIAYATAVIPVTELRPGQVARFATNADVPNSLVRSRVADVLVFTYDK